MVAKVSSVLLQSLFSAESKNHRTNNILEKTLEQMAPRSKKSIVNDAVISIVSDSRLRGNWVTLSTLIEALKQRHDFGDHFEVTSSPLSAVLTKLVPGIDALKQSGNGACLTQHRCVVDDGKTKKIHFFYFQGTEKPPPKHPSINESWDRIRSCQRSILQSFKQQGLCEACKSHRDAGVFNGKHIIQTIRESCGLTDISD